MTSLVLGAALLASCGGSADTGAAATSPSTAASASARPSAPISPSAVPPPLAGPHTSAQLSSALIKAPNLGSGWTVQRIPAEDLADGPLSMADYVAGWTVAEANCQAMISQLGEFPAESAVRPAWSQFGSGNGLFADASVWSVSGVPAAEHVDTLRTLYASCPKLTVAPPGMDEDKTVVVAVAPLDVSMPGFTTASARFSMNVDGLNTSIYSTMGVAGDVAVDLSVISLGTSRPALAALQKAAAAQAAKITATLG